MIVNATALDRSGALGILCQFVENIPEDNWQWLIFVSDKISLCALQPNVRIEPITGVKSMCKRLWWDAFGLNIWLKKNFIEPIACISLQNTGIRVSKKNIPHFIYYHQSIPFFKYSWNIMKVEHHTFWFYKYIYPIFVRLFLRKNTRIFVQLDFIKKGFVRKYHHSADNIEVFSPSVIIPLKNERIDLPQDNLNLFFPATPHFYKNHRIIIKAVNGVSQLVKLYLTIEPSNYGKNVECLGIIPYDKVCAMYNSCDALLFPSYIETYGLPLLEAAMVGLPILAADLPYAREVLSGYAGVKFVKYDDVDAWVKAIDCLGKGDRFKPIDISSRPSWKELFDSIIRITDTFQEKSLGGLK